MDDGNGTEPVEATNTHADMIAAGERLHQDTMKGACKRALGNLKVTLAGVKADLASDRNGVYGPLFDALMDADMNIRKVV